MTAKYKYIIFSILALLCTTIYGCQKEPVSRILESMQCFETAMRTNVDKPEPLLQSMDNCIEQYQDVWTEARTELMNNRPSTVDRQLNVNSVEINHTVQNIIDLDLAIQDHLKDNPQMLSAYMERIRRIY